eukprot:jgi/Hompol1/643/HPOL_000988-RA
MSSQHTLNTSQYQTIQSPRVGTLVVAQKSLLGKGSFASVLLAQSISSPFTTYAIKRIPLDPCTLTPPPTISTEVKALCTLADDPSIVRIHDVVQTPSHIDIIMEHCPTDLFKALGRPEFRQTGIQSFTLARRLIIDLIDAVLACHRRGIFHRDLKPENVLVPRACSSGVQRTLKLCDFGLCTF